MPQCQDFENGLSFNDCLNVHFGRHRSLDHIRNDFKALGGLILKTVYRDCLVLHLPPLKLAVTTKESFLGYVAFLELIK